MDPHDSRRPRFGIIGMGYVGRNLADQLAAGATIVSYDLIDGADYPAAELESCELTFVCVDTPMADDGSCDTSKVEEAVDRVPSRHVVIRSTVPPGTTDDLARRTDKQLCHFPEFYGEGEHNGLPRPDRMTDDDFCVIGGPPAIRDEVIELLMPLYGPGPRWHVCTAIESELIKYMENCFLATKVAFTNEFRDVCSLFGASWPAVREGWLLDPRIGRSHTAVFRDQPGFAGSCLPKDLAAIRHAAAAAGYTPPILQAVFDANRHRRERATDDIDR